MGGEKAKLKDRLLQAQAPLEQPLKAFAMRREVSND